MCEFTGMCVSICKPLQVSGGGRRGGNWIGEEDEERRGGENKGGRRGGDGEGLEEVVSVLFAVAF